MAIHDLFATEKKIRTALDEIAKHGLGLHGRKSQYSLEGLRAEWEKLTKGQASRATALAAEVEAIAQAVDKIEGYERAHLLPPVTTPTAAQELTVARLVARPGFAKELADVGPIIRPYLGTLTATVLVEELQARNKYITEGFIGGVLKDESLMYASTMQAAAHAPTAVGMLRAGVKQLRHALDLETSVIGHPVDSNARPGHHTRWLPLSTVYKPESGLKVNDQGNFNL